MTTWAFEGIRTATIDGTKLAYQEKGEGAPVVFVHGTASDLRIWRQQLPCIGASYRAIAYSRRYAPPNKDIDPGVDDQMLPHVDDLAAFLLEIDAAPAHLVGHSWGAFICLLTAIRYPEVVRSLVLEEPPVVPLLGLSSSPRPSELLSLFARRPRAALAIAKFGAGTIGPAQKAFRRGDEETALRTIACGLLGKKSYRQLPEEHKQQFRENASTVRAQTLGAGFPPLNKEDVRGVRVPTLLISGELSPGFLHRLVDRLQELLPNVERISIANASHLMHVENSRAVNEAILTFVGRVDAQP
jgi:pimeloyl-ACP methyl ester carboxylesterase